MTQQVLILVSFKRKASDEFLKEIKISKKIILIVMLRFAKVELLMWSVFIPPFCQKLSVKYNCNPGKMRLAKVRSKVELLKW